MQCQGVNFTYAARSSMMLCYCLIVAGLAAFTLFGITLYATQA